MTTPNGSGVPHDGTGDALKRRQIVPPKPAPPSAISKLRNDLESNFKLLAEFWTSVRRPPPEETGDYSYVPKDEPNGYFEAISKVTPRNVSDLLQVEKHKIEGEPVDDRAYWLEHMVKMAARFPPKSKATTLINNVLTAQLWNDIKHPPSTFLGKEFQYRSADGSNNNIYIPQLGAANTPYARTVKPMGISHVALPDPGVVFDSVMCRKEAKSHENKISSMLFYLGTVIIHDLFRTSHEDFNISTTSSYLDLSPLYGSNFEEQKMMRTFKDGKIKPDCFSEKRVLGFPPGVGALLIMFNRWHNRAAENLAAINENGRFSKPRSNDKVAWTKYDEDVFQTARLVTCGLYMNLIITDYVRTILNLNRADSAWKIDPRNEILLKSSEVPLGTGNQVSAEFNLIYRWHSAISRKDEKWIEDRYKDMFNGKDPGEVSQLELLRTLSEWESKIPVDPLKRPFANLHRDKHHTFSDDDLVDIITGGIEDVANAFGARMVPPILRAVEILGIKQARSWNLASLNEFRRHFNLKTYKTFEDMNSDPYVAEQLRRLYDTTDQVELYTGLVCENPKKDFVPGSGIMLPYTTSRAILSDAVALIRGDRFYTTDFHPRNLTNWGFAEANPDPAISIDDGAVFYKLFFTSFPEHFKENSVYAHFPLTHPYETKVILESLKKDHIYNFDRPKRKPRQIAIESYDACYTMLEDQAHFGVTWGPAMQYLMGPDAKNFMLAGDGQTNKKSRKLVTHGLYPSEWESDIKNFYEHKTRELLEGRKYELAGIHQVDIIRDVTNMVHVHFCAEMFALPLKTKAHPHGVFTDHELYLILVAVFTCVFFDVDPEQSFKVHKASREATKLLGELMEGEVESIKNTGFFSNIVQYFYTKVSDSESPAGPSSLQKYGVHMIQRLLDHMPEGMSTKELVWGHILGTAGGMVPNQGQLFAQMLDYYFTEASDVWPDIAAEACKNTPEADEKLKKYVMEGSRLGCGSAVMRWVRTPTAHVVDGRKTYDLKMDDKIFVNMYTASRDPTAFPDPLKVDLDRPDDSYIQFGQGAHKCLGYEIARTGLAGVLKEVAKLPQLRPVPGPQGRVQKIPSTQAKGYYQYLTEGWESFFPFPTSLRVNWDDDWDDTPHIPRTPTAIASDAAPALTEATTRPAQNGTPATPPKAKRGRKAKVDGPTPIKSSGHGISGHQNGASASANGNGTYQNGEVKSMNGASKRNTNGKRPRGEVEDDDHDHDVLEGGPVQPVGRGSVRLKSRRVN